MAAISQTIFKYICLNKKCLLFRVVWLTISQPWFRKWLDNKPLSIVYTYMHHSTQGFLYTSLLGLNALTHWGRVTHICVSKLTIIGSDNGLSPGWRQAIIWTNAGILLIRNLGRNFSEILSKIPAFSSKKMHLKMSSVKRRPFCLGLNVLKRR